MRSIILSLSVLVSTTSFAGDIESAFDMEVIKRRCGPAQAGEPIVYSSDFSWNQTLPQMKEKFEQIYHTDKRLKGRAYYDVAQNSVVLPQEVFGQGNKVVRLSERFLKSITLHVERALQRGYVNFVFFPDMGHSHIHIPQSLWDSTIQHINDRTELYEKMLNHPDVRYLYHTAEQLKMLGEDKKPVEDRHIQWRLYTRNLVGDNKAQGRLDFLFEPTSDVNTAHGEEGYRYWGGGFNIHSSQNGCFPYKYKDKIYYFDLSLEDLAPSTTGGDMF